MSIAWILQMGSFESLLDINEVNVARDSSGYVLVLWMILEPRVHIVKSLFFRQLISETDPQRQQTVQVVRVLLMSFLEGQNRLFVLV